MTFGQLEALLQGDPGLRGDRPGGMRQPPRADMWAELYRRAREE